MLYKNWNAIIRTKFEGKHAFWGGGDACCKFWQKNETLSLFFSTRKKKVSKGLNTTRFKVRDIPNKNPAFAKVTKRNRKQTQDELEINQGKTQITFLLSELGKTRIRRYEKQDKHIFHNFIFVFHQWSYLEVFLIDYKSLGYLFFFLYNIPLLSLSLSHNFRISKKFLRMKLFYGLTDFISGISMTVTFVNTKWLEYSVDT